MYGSLIGFKRLSRKKLTANLKVYRTLGLLLFLLLFLLSLLGEESSQTVEGEEDDTKANSCSQNNRVHIGIEKKQGAYTTNLYVMVDIVREKTYT
jgi:hypothetical protein